MSEPNYYGADEVLIGLFCSGKKSAFDVLYKRYSNVVVETIRNKVRVKEEAEDLFHDFMLHLSYKLQYSYREKGQFKSWLLRSLNNYICSYFRKKKQIFVDLNLESYNQSLYEDDSEYMQLKEKMLICLEEFLKTLPESSLKLLRMRYWEGISYKEISRRTHIKYPTIVSMIRTIHKKLISFMEERGYTRFDL